MGFLGGTLGIPDSNAIVPAGLGTGREPVVPAFLAWGDPLTDPADQLGQLHFDVVLVEDHERDSEVTDHSVEQGVSLTDHVRPLPDTITLSTFVSNTPINSRDAQLLPLTLDIPQPNQGGLLAGGTTALAGNALLQLGIGNRNPTTITATVQQFPGDTDYVQLTYDNLTALRDAAILITVATPHQVYTNMIVKRIALHRDSGTGTGGEFEIDLRQIRIVSSSIVDAPLPSLVQATPLANKGKIDPTAASAPKQSVALKYGLDSGLNIGNGPASNVGVNP